MKITETQIRKIIREELLRERSSKSDAADRAQQDADILVIQDMLTKAFDPSSILDGTDEEALIDAVSMIDTRYKYEKINMWSGKTYNKSLDTQISDELETIDLPYAQKIFDILSRNLSDEGLHFERVGSGVKLIRDTLMNSKGYYQAP